MPAKGYGHRLTLDQFKNLCARRTKTAVKVLDRIVRGKTLRGEPDLTWRDRLTAMQLLMEHGYGKPAQRQVHTLAEDMPPIRIIQVNVPAGMVQEALLPAPSLQIEGVNDDKSITEDLSSQSLL